MKTCYMAFAKFTDGSREWFTNISKHDTQDEAETQAEDFHKRYTEGIPKILYTGVKKFYLYTHKEWDKNPYKSKIDGKNATIEAGDKGTVLIFEHDDFEII